MGEQRSFSLANSSTVQSDQSITSSRNWEKYMWYGTQWIGTCHCLPLTSPLALFSRVSHFLMASLTRFLYHGSEYFISYDSKEESVCRHWHLTVCLVIKSANVSVLSTSAFFPPHNTALVFLSRIFYMKGSYINHNSEFFVFLLAVHYDFEILQCNISSKYSCCLDVKKSIYIFGLVSANWFKQFYKTCPDYFSTFLAVIIHQYNLNLLARVWSCDIKTEFSMIQTEL